MARGIIINLLFGAIAQYAKVETVKVKTYLTETETWINFLTGNVEQG